MPDTDGPHRVVTLFTMELDPRTLDPGSGRGVEDVWPLGGLARHYVDAGEWTPRILAERAHEATTLDLASDARHRIHQVRTWMFANAYGPCVVALDVLATADRSELVRLQADLFWKKDRATIGGEPWWWIAAPDQLRSELRRRSEGRGPLLLNTLQVLVVPRIEFLQPATAPSDGAIPDELDLGVDLLYLRHLLFKQEVETRPRYNRIRFPEGGNGSPQELTAVWGSNVVLAAPSHHFEHATIISAVQVLAATRRSSQLRRSARDMLVRLRSLAQEPLGDHEGRRAQLRDLSQELAQLQLELSFGVQDHLDSKTHVPVGALSSYHRALATEKGLTDSAAITADIVQRVADVLTSERSAVAAAESAHNERRLQALLTETSAVRTLAAVAGAIAAVVAAVGLFAALAAVPSGGEIVFAPVLRAASAAMLTVLIAGGFGWMLRRLAALDPPSNRTPVLALATVTALAASGMLTMAALGVDPVGPLTTGGLLTSLLSAFLFAWAGEFEAPDSSP